MRKEQKFTLGDPWIANKHKKKGSLSLAMKKINSEIQLYCHCCFKLNLKANVDGSMYCSYFIARNVTVQLLWTTDNFDMLL